MLDGLNLSNHFDPAETQMNSMQKVAGCAYGLNLDSRNLCQLTVYDANVPAKYGDFTGGVVEAETCKLSEAFSG